MEMEDRRGGPRAISFQENGGGRTLSSGWTEDMVFHQPHHPSKFTQPFSIITDFQGHVNSRIPVAWTPVISSDTIPYIEKSAFSVVKPLVVLREVSSRDPDPAVSEVISSRWNRFQSTKCANQTSVFTFMEGDVGADNWLKSRGPTRSGCPDLSNFSAPSHVLGTTPLHFHAICNTHGRKKGPPSPSPLSPWVYIFLSMIWLFPWEKSNSLAYRVHCRWTHS